VSAREVALQVVRDVFPSAGEGRSAQDALDYRLRAAHLDSRDRAFATELAYGAIKMRRALDWYLQPYIGGRRATLPASTGEILRLAVYELRYTRADAYASVNEFVALAKRHGHRGLGALVNGVLRTMLREPPLEPSRELFESDDDYLGTRYSLPTWLVRQWRDVFGAERLDAICAGVNGAAQHAITANLRAIDPLQLAGALDREGVAIEVSPFVAESLVIRGGAETLRTLDVQGRWWTQSESSAVGVALLQPQPGERILDACSGRGNKALQIVGRLEGNQSLTCVDRDLRKVRVLQDRFAEFGMTAAAIAGDVSDANLLTGLRFDRVLLDAPCSGVGVVGRHPEARWKKRSTDGRRLAETQAALLEATARHVYPGGALVYCVCSTDPRESVEVVDSFLARNNFSYGLVPSNLGKFLTERGDISIAPGIDGRDGFYYARLEAGQ
jgi:16S rRNA (cytosine967-C5)-methyltransferase